MRKTALLTFAFVATLALVAVTPLPVHAGDMGTVTKTGEIIDSACYIQKGAKGPGHKECAEKCADAGIPLALLEDGTNEVIWLTSADHGSANEQLKPYAAEKVSITGTLSERGGTKLLTVEKIEPTS
jgi:hypothetical protein